MNVLFYDAMQDSDAPKQLISSILADRYEYTSVITVNLGHTRRINAFGIGNTDAAVVYLNFDGITWMATTISGNGLYLLPEMETDRVTIRCDGSYIGRFALGKAVNLKTSIPKEPTLVSTNNPRVTLSGQVIDGLGGYDYWRVSLDTRYKIDRDKLSEIIKGFPSLSRGLPMFVSFEDEKERLPFERLYVNDTNQQELSFESSINKPLFSRRFIFEGDRRGTLLMSVLFTANLAKDIEAKLSFVPSNAVSRRFDVYEVYHGKYPGSTYWTTWGGYYDNAIANQIELYIDEHNLVRVNSLADCAAQEYSIFSDTIDQVSYVNVPRHTWLYNEVVTNYRVLVGYLSGPKNPSDPSDDVIDGEHYPVRLETPKLSNKLSDVVNGITKYSTFDIALFNDDGYFDDAEVTNLFNSVIYINKTWKDNPSLNDFITIRYGIIESLKIDSASLTLSCADIFRTLEAPVSKVVKDVFTTATTNTDENLPLIYGTVKIDLIEIDTGKYVAGENITSVGNVYDKDGNVVSYTVDADKIISSSAEDVDSAVVTGSTSNRIGEIIVDVIKNKGKLDYIDSYWDLAETNVYRNNSPRINIAFTGGTARNAVKDALKSDMVFLIQKNDGKLTLRTWGTAYSTFDIENWQITKFPTKDFSSSQQNYLSSCTVYYNHDFSGNKYGNTLLYDADEEAAEARYSKLVRKEFFTDLTTTAAASDLGAKLSGRFSFLKETIQIGVGFDTSEINLLDTVNLEMKINDRKFSNYTKWIVKEIDPAQDFLLLESTS
jgi:hypothetical protein